ncbi:NAD-dependent epimerase/dehydratase family protein [Streptomyces sp. NPDC052101]|uniref:NAD-dependent epimerase/dehydratase family protein n=1 Tax=Streptomyces sp. NPDC052101 TaxID=3155763 RepID=UPI003445E026
MAHQLLITGANGFIGGHVLTAALARPDLGIRVTRHHGPVSVPGQGQVQVTHADLADASSVPGLCRGIDAVVHCASRIGGDGASLRAVNDEGTKALVADAQRHGVRRFVYVSTAAVYGRGPFRQADSRTLPVRPHSPTSHTRAAAEQHVLAAGGTVLRPHLVYGTGDRWVIPGLAFLTRQLGAEVECSSLHSAVEVTALAEAALAAALSDRETAGAHDVNHPSPVRADVLAAAVRHCLEPAVTGMVDTDVARERLADNPQALHHLDMLTADHWFLSSAIWRLLDRDPGPAPEEDLARHLPWYRQHLRSLVPSGH